MKPEHIKRILVYTHNSIGLGHAFRTLAVVTGIRKWRPDINFLVISSTSIPQLFLSQGIELVKLPSVKIDIDSPDHRMIARYLHDFDVETLFDYRQRIILETFDFFKPDVLMVEHNMTGQMSELIPLLMKKWMRTGGPADFALVHMCRGIMRWVPLLEIPYENPRHRSESINIGALYDAMYVLEDREVIDINKAFLGDDPELEPKITYLGKITNRAPEELRSRAETFAQFKLPDRPTVLLSLGRSIRVPDLLVSLLEIFEAKGVLDDYQVAMVLDPYLDGMLKQKVERHPLSKKAIFLPFAPDMVDLINHSEMVVSRAGYNTVNEILLTGPRALIIPEAHGGGEQEQRVSNMPGENILVLKEDDLLGKNVDSEILQLLKSPRKRPPHRYDKYAIGNSIITDLEAWFSARVT
jgi:predicted glycosyltransferase